MGADDIPGTAFGKWGFGLHSAAPDKIWSFMQIRYCEFCGDWIPEAAQSAGSRDAELCQACLDNRAATGIKAAQRIQRTVPIFPEEVPLETPRYSVAPILPPTTAHFPAVSESSCTKEADTAVAILPAHTSIVEIPTPQLPEEASATPSHTTSVSVFYFCEICTRRVAAPGPQSDRLSEKQVRHVYCTDCSRNTARKLRGAARPVRSTQKRSGSRLRPGNTTSSKKTLLIGVAAMAILIVIGVALLLGSQ